MYVIPKLKKRNPPFKIGLLKKSSTSFFLCEKFSAVVVLINEKMEKLTDCLQKI